MQIVFLYFVLNRVHCKAVRFCQLDFVAEVHLV